ncbi:hypothetical protein MSUIS_01810 [Mycoplasma suis KI3806]|uniref:Uncharacterized protein n=1 Tax=Mycoplasma suis (strain KI_3806) TaxID=708248 RepID=F0V352_MYCS3|nr:hypothetical protein MSUIS_01810 [Mycoplasma suis KI3806]
MQLRSTIYLLAPIILGASSLSFVFSTSSVNTDNVFSLFSFIDEIRGGGIEQQQV